MKRLTATPGFWSPMVAAPQVLRNEGDVGHPDLRVVRPMATTIRPPASSAPTSRLAFRKVRPPALVGGSAGLSPQAEDRFICRSPPTWTPI